VHRWARKAILPVGIVIGLGFFALAGAFGRTDDGQVKDEEGLEAVAPVNTAEAQPRQTVVVADLASGYDGQLTIDGTVIPRAQMELDQGLNKLIFRPGDGKVVTEFHPGQVNVSITYWPLEQGIQQGRIYRWSFSVV
jgi:hypothetical protein